MTELLLQTTNLSLAVQVLAGVWGSLGFFKKLPARDRALQTSLGIETAVQIVELLFYVGFVSSFNADTMAETRYKDWLVTTPAMLVSAMLYFSYEQARESASDGVVSLKTLFRESWPSVAAVLISNFLMVAFGYAGETGLLPVAWCAAFGFLALAVTFLVMWKDLASQSKRGRRVFWFMLAAWSLYGLAFLLPTVPKNVSYNLLDVVAKNFFGVYLAIEVMRSG